MPQLYYEILKPKDLVEYYNRNRAIIENTKKDYNYLAPKLESGTVGGISFYNAPFSLLSIVPELLRVKLRRHSDYLCYFHFFIERTRYLFKLLIDQSAKQVGLTKEIIKFKETFDIELIKILSFFPNPRTLDARILIENPSLEEYQDKYYPEFFTYSNNIENYNDKNYQVFIKGIDKSNIIEFLSFLYEDIYISRKRSVKIDLYWYLFSIHLKLHCGYNIYTLFNDNEDINQEDIVSFLLGEQITEQAEKQLMKVFKSISPNLNTKEKKELLLQKRHIINNQKVYFEKTIIHKTAHSQSSSRDC